jgi:hypothetical protein
MVGAAGSGFEQSQEGRGRKARFMHWFFLHLTSPALSFARSQRGLLVELTKRQNARTGMYGYLPRKAQPSGCFRDSFNLILHTVSPASPRRVCFSWLPSHLIIHNLISEWEDCRPRQQVGPAQRGLRNVSCQVSGAFRLKPFPFA